MNKTTNEPTIESESLEAAPVDPQKIIKEAVQKCSTWYDTDKDAKTFYVDEMKEMYKLYRGDHWSLLGPDGNPLRTTAQQMARPNSVENITFSLIEGTASEFAQDVELIDYPVEQGDEEKANVMTDLKKFIFYKNRLTTERIKFLRRFFLYGTGIWHISWDPDWRGGKGPNRWVGDIRWNAMHPLELVPDARCKEDINEGNRCHKVAWRTLEEVKQKYPNVSQPITEESMDEDDMLDLSKEDSEGFTDDSYKEDQIPVIETWYTGRPLILDEGEEQDQGDGLHVIWWAGESQKIYLKHANYIYFDPEETPKFPFIVKQCYQREGSIWGYGEAYFMKNPQIARNKTGEIILEGHMHEALGQTWYEEGALTPKQEKVIQAKGTIPGMWFKVQDASKIKREYAKSVPASLQNEMQRLQSAMETIIGRFDISQGRTPGDVTAYKAIAELSARAQVRLRIKEMAITSSYEEGGTYTNRLIEQYYTENRKYRILGEEGYQYGEYRQEDMLKVWDTGTGAVAPFNQTAEQIPNFEAIKQLQVLKEAGMISEEEFAAQMAELGADNYEVYFPDMDCYCKTSSVTPSDRFYSIEVAKDLLMKQLISPKIFFYVIDNGKFPPSEELQQELESMAEPKVIDMVEVLPPELQQYMKGLPPEQIVSEMETILKTGAMSILQQGQGQEDGGTQQQQEIPTQQAI